MIVFNIDVMLDPNTKIGASTLQALDEGNWDYVVLQEQSAQPIKSDEPEYMNSVTELSNRVGITMANISILKNGKARAIRVETLNKLCRALDCQPGDLLEYREDGET